MNKKTIKDYQKENRILRKLQKSQEDLMLAAEAKKESLENELGVVRLNLSAANNEAIDLRHIISGIKSEVFNQGFTLSKPIRRDDSPIRPGYDDTFQNISINTADTPNLIDVLKGSF